MRVLPNPTHLQQDGVEELGTRDVFWASKGSSSLSAPALLLDSAFFLTTQRPSSLLLWPRHHNECPEQTSCWRDMGQALLHVTAVTVPLPISCQPPPMQNSFLAPKQCQSGVITFCFVTQVPSAQVGNEMVTVGWWARAWRGSHRNGFQQLAGNKNISAGAWL